MTSGNSPFIAAWSPVGNLLTVSLRASPAMIAFVELPTPVSVEWFGIEGATAGYNMLSADGRFAFIAIEGIRPRWQSSTMACARSWRPIPSPGMGDSMDSSTILHRCAKRSTGSAIGTCPLV
jgi:hypothetical protein